MRAGAPVAQAVAVAPEAENVGVMDEPVDHRRRDGIPAKDLAPGAERLVACDEHQGSLATGTDEREHEVRGLGVEGI